MNRSPSAVRHGLLTRAGLLAVCVPGASFLASFLLGLPVRAANVPARPVAVLAEGCPGEEAPPFLAAAVAILRSELALDAFACCAGDDGSRGVVRVTVSAVCEGAGPSGVARASGVHVEVRAADPQAGRTTERRLDLGDVQPAARPRTLALAIAEALRGLGQEPSEPGSSVPAPPFSATSPGSVLRMAVGAAALARAFPGADTLLLGGGLFGWLAEERWWATLGVDAATGSRDVAEGTIRLHTLTLAAGGGVRGRWGATSVAVGPAVELVRGTIRGTAASPAVVAHEGSGTAVTLLGRLELGRQLTPAWGLWAATAAGPVLHRLDAKVDDVRAAGLSGVAVSLTVGLRFGGL